MPLPRSLSAAGLVDCRHDGTIESFSLCSSSRTAAISAASSSYAASADKLAALRVDEEFDAVIQKATLIADKLGVVGAVMGARLEQQVNSYVGAIAQFA